ncbi:NADP-dependent 3-hydroxy acid dehydrogenase YdfG [Actinopolymorpha singaporensis]|uniref:NADP-dependent 3-hydroxy acid dehydrogenase YdfG n=1 Tax=Actinopolymorpha singaporensis TaxID=117157 RepID=A0A1H1R8G4_9ACTN|nr:SDR family oxidoreductase [Actinopolymorpha singaporensis]SDS31970.1 NADP-dependent 3-hydroxy acid dehydrogenase YdfG [Actinopolymorpha singaporensis]
MPGVLNGKVAVVTGATSGIGATTAERMVNEGASVVLAGRRRHRGEEIAARLGPAADFLATDVTSEEDMRDLITRAVERFGRLDCLVNSAGDGGSPASVLSMDLQRFRYAFDVHVLGACAGVKYAGPIMVEQGSGSIVNVSSVSARLAGWSSTDYSAAKAALVQYTRCAAAELGAHGVRVNSVSPGPILSGIQARPPASTTTEPTMIPMPSEISSPTGSAPGSRSGVWAFPRMSRRPSCGWPATPPLSSPATTWWSMVA